MGAGFHFMGMKFRSAGSRDTVSRFRRDRRRLRRGIRSPTRDVDAGLDGADHAGHEDHLAVGDVVDIEAHVVQGVVPVVFLAGRERIGI